MSRRWMEAEPEGGRSGMAVIGPALFSEVSLVDWLNTLFAAEAHAAAKRMFGRLERVPRLRLRREIAWSADIDDRLVLGRPSRLRPVRQRDGWSADRHAFVARCRVAISGRAELLGLGVGKGLRIPRATVGERQLVIEVGYDDPADAMMLPLLVASEITLIEQHLAVQREQLAAYRRGLARQAKCFVDATWAQYQARHEELRQEFAVLDAKVAPIRWLIETRSPYELSLLMQQMMLSRRAGIELAPLLHHP